MDIRNFLKKPRLEESNQSDTQSSESFPSVSFSTSIAASTLAFSPGPSFTREFDIGRYIGPVSDTDISPDKKCEIFIYTWIPDKTYNFKKIGEIGVFDMKLRAYAPWLAYSEVADGAFCKFCVLFKQRVRGGLQGSFILKGFKNYKEFNDATRNHGQSEWHKNALSDGTNLMAIK